MEQEKLAEVKGEENMQREMEQKAYSYEEVFKKATEYFKGDTLAANVPSSCPGNRPY